MNHTISTCLLISITALTGCSGGGRPVNKDNVNRTDYPLASLDRPDSIVHQDSRIRGRLVVNTNSGTLAPCAGQEQYLLVLNDKQRQALAKQAHHPYQELYAELGGYLEAPSQTGYNADYRARMVVNRIIQVGDDAVRGCALSESPETDDRWVADYQAQSQTDNGLQISLSLAPNHSAVTRYTYPDKPNDVIVESGFWQALNAQQIEVVMTQYQQQYLITKRIFTRSGNTLTANLEKIGQKVYPIHNGGLTLYKVGQ